MHSTAALKFWLALMIGCIFVTPFFRSSEQMYLYAQGELRVTQEVFGNEVAQSIAQKSLFIIDLLPKDAKNGEPIDKAGQARTKKAVPKSGEAVVHGLNEYSKSLVYNLFVAMIRFRIVMFWMLILGPVLIAGAIDGFTQRAIKRVEFGVIRPAAFTYTAAVVVPLLIGPILYLFLPWTVTPMILPAWALITCIPLSLMIANMQPLFSRH